MPRKKRGYEREISKKRDYHLFAIACEGSVRERDYFQSFERLSSRITVDLINDLDENGDPVVTTNSSPEHVIKRAQDYCKSAGLIDGDEVWLVLDVDRWREEQLGRLCQLAQSKGWHTAISNPCFEVWLCYHLLQKLENQDRPLSSAEMKQFLGRLTLPKGYNVGDFVVRAFSAMENARDADAHPDFRIPQYGETQVYRLLDAMKKYTTAEELEKFCKG